MVLMAPHFFNEDICVQSIARAKAAYEDGQLKPGLEKYHGANTDVAFYGWNGAWLDPGFLDWNIEEFLPAITAPSLILQGADDEYGTLKQIEAAQQKCGRAPVTRVFKNCGHSPQRDQPELVLSAVSSFVAEL